MQQTEHYSLNLIETSDTFTPQPLNENTQALDAKLADLDTQAGSLNSRGIGRTGWCRWGSPPGWCGSAAP